MRRWAFLIVMFLSMLACSRITVDDYVLELYSIESTTTQGASLAVQAEPQDESAQQIAVSGSSETSVDQSESSSEADSPAETATQTPDPAFSSTPVPTDTLIPTNTIIPTDTPVPTPVPTSTPANTATPVASSCDQADFIQNVYLDIPVYDGTAVHPGTEFTVTWRLKNIGSCTWTRNYSIKVIQNQGWNSIDKVQAFTSGAAPGDTVDLSFSMTAPKSPGNYSISWILTNHQGRQFGKVTDSGNAFALSFGVLDLADGVNFDFTAARCQAQWHSSLASFLPCQGDPTGGIGYVRYDSSPALEHKSSGNPPVINVRTSNGSGGKIFGRYPPYTVKSGDVFRATIGCMANEPDCDLAYKLNIEDMQGNIRTIRQWGESSDGKVQNVSLDLRKLAGEELRFILFVRVGDGPAADANGFWMNPRIGK